jgi:hypothetical protein
MKCRRPTPILRSWPGLLTILLIGAVTRSRFERLQSHVLERVRSERVRLAAVARLVDTIRLLGEVVLLSGIRAETAVAIAEKHAEAIKAPIFGIQSDALQHAFTLLGARVTTA